MQGIAAAVALGRRIGRDVTIIWAKNTQLAAPFLQLFERPECFLADVGDRAVALRIFNPTLLISHTTPDFNRLPPKEKQRLLAEQFDPANLAAHKAVHIQ